MNLAQVRIRLEPLSIEVDVPRGTLLMGSLSGHGIEFPCGGTGGCGGCGVRVLAGSLPITEADRTVFSKAQLDDGWRLACQARAPGAVAESLVLECRQWRMEVLGDNTSLAGAGKRGLGIAIDLGTTTIATQIVDLATGNVLGVETELNPQAGFGSDVMSRIRAALEMARGSDRRVVREALRADGGAPCQRARGRGCRSRAGGQHGDASPVLRLRRGTALACAIRFARSWSAEFSPAGSWLASCRQRAPFVSCIALAALLVRTFWPAFLLRA